MLGWTTKTKLLDANNTDKIKEDIPLLKVLGFV